MKFDYRYQGKLHSVELLPGGQALVDGQPVEVGDIAAEVAARGRNAWVHFDGRTYTLERAVGGNRATGGSSELVLRAPMPGQVRHVAVAAGQRVEAGQLLLVLEAMKMEMRISAPQAAKVARLDVSQGDSVDKEQILVELENESE